MSSLRRILLLMACLPLVALAEGTKQLIPVAADSAGRGVIVAGRNGAPNGYGFFAVPQATPDNRLWFSVASTTETVFLGMQWLYPAPGRFLIKNSAGTKVLDTTNIPTAGPGFISSYARAIAGPSAVTPGGYNALVFAPPAPGDYFIEFIYAIIIGSNPPDAVLRYFDLTIADATNTAIDGRLWSRNWYLSTMGDTGDDVFRGKLYAYSNDQIVTEINFNALRPHLFRVGCNANGCNDFEPFVLARKSRAENSVYPQYKVFLNDPDPLLFATGIPGQITSAAVTNDCNGSLNLHVGVTKPGTISVLIGINPVPGFQSEDVNLVVAANAGNNTITWNGLDGLGNQVANGTPITIGITYINGLTNLPLYDIEASTAGFIVNLVRPAGPNPAVYWDDSQVGGTSQPDGCLNPAGCHTWPLAVGNNNTINTWWYAFTDVWPTMPWIYRRHQAISLTEHICPTDSVLFAGSYLHTGGFYSHTFMAALGCDSLVNLTLELMPGPVVELGPDTLLCQGGPLLLQAGTGIGFTYLWNTGSTEPAIVVTATGTYSVVAMATNGCTDSDGISVTAAPAIVPKPIRHQ